MAKELPFFMFEPSEWMFGRIQRQPNEIKGIFIDLLCKYWHKRCEILHRDARLDFGEAIDNLVDSEVITIDDDGYIRIDFLDIQMNKIGEKSKRMSIAGKRSAEARAQQNPNNSSTTVEQTIQDNTRQDNTIQNNIEKYDVEVVNCLQNCLKHFPTYLTPSENNLWKWADVVEKLNRIDKIPYEKVYEIVQKTRADDFWCKNFLSMPKLRQKNKEGIKYIVVFNEQIKGSKNGQQTYQSAEQFVGSAKDISARLGLND